MAEWKPPSRTVERPMAPDVREFAKWIQGILNELDVHVGEKFTISAVEKSSRLPILRARKRDDQAADRAAEQDALEASQDSLL